LMVAAHHSKGPLSWKFEWGLRIGLVLGLDLGAGLRDRVG